MDSFTSEVRQWLERRFSLNSKRPYRPHRTNELLGQGRPGFLSDLGMAARIATVLSRLEFNSLLDVGAADGFNAALFRQLFGAFSAASDLSSEALCRAYEQYGLSGAAADCQRLPFQDNSFDVVLSNEVIEHVSDPIAAMLEVYRVSRRFIIISTLEYTHRAFWRPFHARLLNPSFIHDHRTAFTHSDFRALFPRCTLMPQLQDVGFVSPFELDDKGMSVMEAKEKLIAMATPSAFGYRKYGVLALITKGDARLSTAERVSLQQIVDALIEPILPPAASAARGRPDTDLLERLACPACGSSLYQSDTAADLLLCTSCQRRYPVKVTTPQLYPEEARELADLPESEFRHRYPGVNRARALKLRATLTSMRRTSNRYERPVLRFGAAVLNMALAPREFTRYHLNKSIHK